MMRSKFYVCPICGNVIHSMGECVIGCHGIQLYPLSDEPSDEHHMIFIERSDDEYYVRIDHSMTKEHFISFVAATGIDEIQMVKLYPEGKAEARFKIRGVKRRIESGGYCKLISAISPLERRSLFANSMILTV